MDLVHVVRMRAEAAALTKKPAKITRAELYAFADACYDRVKHAADQPPWQRTPDGTGVFAYVGYQPQCTTLLVWTADDGQVYWRAWVYDPVAGKHNMKEDRAASLAAARDACLAHYSFILGRAFKTVPAVIARKTVAPMVTELPSAVALVVEGVPFLLDEVTL